MSFTLGETSECLCLLEGQELHFRGKGPLPEVPHVELSFIISNNNCLELRRVIVKSPVKVKIQASWVFFHFMFSGKDIIWTHQTKSKACGK